MTTVDLSYKIAGGKVGVLLLHGLCGLQVPADKHELTAFAFDLLHRDGGRSQATAIGPAPALARAPV